MHHSRRVTNRGIIARMLGRVPAEKPLSVRFAVDQDSIPPEFFGLTSYGDPVAAAPRTDRRTAMQVPAVKRGRDLIAGTLGTLPLELFGPDNVLAASTLLEQPERHVPRSVTIARTIEDLLFEGVAWWLITEYGWHTYPTKVIRLDPRSVTVRKDGKVYVTRQGNRGQVTEYAEDKDLIRFDSPNDPLLVVGARAIRTALTLDAAAERYASGNQPLDYFAPADGFDPNQEDVDAALEAWEAARRLRATGYVPGALTYNTAGWNPEQLQLSDARQHAVLEIARVMGIDPEDLGVSTTSRTYFNAFDRKQARIQDTLRGYMVAFEERLSMGDVTPRGYKAKFNLSDMLRSDDLTRFQAYAAGREVGVYEGPDEIRAAEGKPALGGAPAPAPAEQEPADA
jgi:phage portal protein BeeE